MRDTPPDAACGPELTASRRANYCERRGAHRAAQVMARSPGSAAVARAHEDEYTQQVMQALKAKVQKGRLVLDEPTDLPEGEVIELVPADDVLANGGDHLDDEERERLHESIERGLEDVKAGRTVDASVVIEKLRSRAANGQ